MPQVNFRSSVSYLKTELIFFIQKDSSIHIAYLQPIKSSILS